MIKKYSLSENNKRSLLCLSDGELFYRYCMAAETIQNLFDIEKLHVFCVIRLERLQVFTKKSKKFIFVLEVTPVADENNVNLLLHLNNPNFNISLLRLLMSMTNCNRLKV